MKRVQMFLAGAFIAVGSLYAQSSDAEWQAGVAKLKETIQTNPAQAAEEAEHLIKGKNKKNVELLVAVHSRVVVLYAALVFINDNCMDVVCVVRAVA